MNDIDSKKNTLEILTFFSTLDTNFPHQDINSVLHKLVELSFNGRSKDRNGYRKCLTVIGSDCVWAKEKRWCNSYTMQPIKIKTNYLFKECYVIYYFFKV